MDNRRLVLALIGINVVASGTIGFVLLQQSGYLASHVEIGKGSLLAQFVPDSPNIADRRSPVLQEGHRLQVISTHQVTSAVPSSERNKILFYEKGSGKVFETMLDQPKENTVSNARLANFIKTVWSPSTKEVISEFSSGNRFRYFNYETKRVALFPTGTQSVAFAPDGNKVAYFRTQGEQGSLFIAQPDGSYATSILVSRITDMALRWPEPETITLETAQGTKEEKEVWTITPEGSLTRILESKKELETLWSPSGEKLLYSALDDQGQLKLFSKTKASLTEQELPTLSRASQCAWSKGEVLVVCAVPQESGSNQFVEVNLETMETTPIFSGGLNDPTISATDLFFAPGEHYLIFRNSLDNLLYSLAL
ncbi:MAG: hypothetical protein KW806_01465 [Candidatus Yanofskybacteria bacterium]|nr:hypothetical protein [Candidatus Yanofskybacteria bacterium]